MVRVSIQNACDFYCLSCFDSLDCHILLLHINDLIDDGICNIVVYADNSNYSWLLGLNLANKILFRLEKK